MLHICRTYLVGGTPPSVLCSHCLRAVFCPDDDIEAGEDASQNVFQSLGVLRRVAQKVLESAVNEKPSIARPAREARDALKTLEDETLQGLF